MRPATAPKRNSVSRHWSLFKRQVARNRRYWPTVWLAFLVILLDQLVKHWILYGLRLPERLFGRLELSAIFDLTFVKNHGVSFGLFKGGMSSRIVLSMLSVLVTLFLLRWLARQRRALTAMGIGFIMGGALGNVYDRIAYGYVVDFLDFSGAYFPWVFNVADMAINIGVGCLILDAVLQARQKPPQNGGHKAS